MRPKSAAAETFDPTTGLPAEWVRVDLSFFEWEQQWLEPKWPTWAGNSRRAGVEGAGGLRAGD